MRTGTKPVITVVGSFAVGMTIRTRHLPVFGETLFGSDFDMGPGGKGSNQAGASRILGEFGRSQRRPDLGPTFAQEHAAQGQQGLGSGAAPTHPRLFQPLLYHHFAG